jgi:methylisocitrate lyase
VPRKVYGDGSSPSRKALQGPPPEEAIPSGSVDEDHVTGRLMGDEGEHLSAPCPARFNADGTLTRDKDKTRVLAAASDTVLGKQADALRKLIGGGKTVVAPGVFSPAVAKLAEKAGFRALYFSGAGYSNLLALPDLGITTMTEVTQAARQVTSRVEIPVIVDADTGFGEALNAARTVDEMIAARVAAIHIEDQVLPKRCGHLEGKELVETDEMVKKLVSAKGAAGRELLIVARTDARTVEGIDAAIERARVYSNAGADMIFPEALENREEFEEFRQKVTLPLMANMTEFGRTPYFTVKDFDEMGYNLVIFPVTAFRAMMKAVEKTFNRLKVEGTQKRMLSSLMTRREFYDLIDYDRYEEADEKALQEARRLRKGWK